MPGDVETWLRASKLDDETAAGSVDYLRRVAGEGASVLLLDSARPARILVRVRDREAAARMVDELGGISITVTLNDDGSLPIGWGA